MKKKLSFVLVLIIMLLSISPVYADDSQNIENKNDSQKQVEEVLNGFYNGRIEAFEVFYGDNDTNQSDFFYKQTILLYKSKEYDRILEYMAINEVLIVEDHLYGIKQIAETRQINKTLNRTFNPNAGFNFIVTVKYTGTYTYNNGVISNVNVSHNITYKNSSSGYYTVTFPNKSFSAYPLGLKIYINLETDVSAHQNVQPYSTILYPNIEFNTSVTA